MKRCAMVLLACAALAGLVSGRAVAAIPVKVASSVGTSEQNYVNVTYGKLVELAQKYSGGAFEFQLYPDMRLGDYRRPSARSSTAISRCPCWRRITSCRSRRPAAG